jgi:hypothetical protein
MEYRKYFNILLVICLFILIVLLVRRLIYYNKDIFILININDIFSVCAALLLLNKNLYIGMILYLVSFIIYMLIVIFYLPERILRPTTFIRLICTIFLLYEVFIARSKKK